MIRLNKILVGTDFSEHARVALRYGGELAKAFGAEVILLHVLPPLDLISHLPPTGESYFPPNITELQEREAQRQGEEMLKAAALPRARMLLLSGHPFLKIVSTAKEEAVDLIVIGTHGRGAIAHVLLGSVAEKVVRKAPCPVLVVREGEHEFVHP